jgi:hypothetical protein
MMVSGLLVAVVSLLGWKECARGFSSANQVPGRSFLRSLASTRIYWSQQAAVEANQSVQLSGSTIQQHDCVVELSSPRLWLESLPHGVYTVLRCDLFVSDSESRSYLWGIDFHLDRLRQSFSKLYDSKEAHVDEATAESRMVLEALRVTALKEVSSKSDRLGPGDTCVLMLTLLWYPRDISGIFVKGHAYTSGKTEYTRLYNPSPINICLALEGGITGKLPNRRECHPDCKKSSWCSERRPLEENFKAAGIEEVLLTDQQGEVITVLEGLTSNFFAVYPGGVLRTANTGVLCGYARKRILQAAESIGYRVEEAPIGLQEASLWKEVFLTSSIRICQPVQKIVYADSKEVFWEEDPVERDGNQAMWRQLYQHVIIAASL